MEIHHALIREALAQGHPAVPVKDILHSLESDGLVGMAGVVALLKLIHEGVLVVQPNRPDILLLGKSVAKGIDNWENN